MTNAPQNYTSKPNPWILAPTESTTVSIEYVHSKHNEFFKNKFQIEYGFTIDTLETFKANNSMAILSSATSKIKLRVNLAFCCSPYTTSQAQSSE